MDNKVKPQSPKEKGSPTGKSSTCLFAYLQILSLDQACAPGKPQGLCEVTYWIFLLSKEGTQAKRRL